MNLLNPLNLKHQQIKFTGKGGEIFGVYVLNLLLIIITLGFYYPWAKVKIRKYYYANLEFENSPFSFTGTGIEIFKGYIKSIIIFGALYALLFWTTTFGNPLYTGLGILAFYIILLGLLPIIIHGSMKYRMSRTEWRGIRFGYRGNRLEFFKLCLFQFLITVFTFGFYYSWMIVKIRKYMIGNVRMGNIKFDWNGEGGTFFGIFILGYIASIATLGIYSFWWYKDLFNYYVENITMQQEDEPILIKSSATGGDMFKLVVPNALIVIFTLGICKPYADCRLFNFMCTHIHILGELDANKIIQTEDSIGSATGEDMADILDIDII